MTIVEKYWTYGQLRQKVEMDLDLEGELFIQPEEMLGYANEAIEQGEKIIIGIYADYFLDFASLTFVPAQDQYDLPTRMFAHKIRGIVYRNGARCYPVHRVRDWKKFYEYGLNLVGGASEGAEYKFFLVNQGAGTPKILFTPSVTDDGPYATVWFQRQPNKLALDADILDIPEAANYVLQYMKVRCYEKEGHPNLAMALTALLKEEADLQAALAEMIPDTENEIEMDGTFYTDMN